MYRLYYKLCFILFLLLAIFFKAQPNSDFAILLDKAIEKVYKNPNEGINFSQSLLLNEKDPTNQLILQHLISQAYSMKGEYLESVKTSLDKSESERTKNSAFSQIYLDYSLAEQFQNLGLYDQSKKVILQLLPNLSETKIKNKHLQITLAKLYQLQAINFGILKKYKNFEQNIKQSNSLLETKPKENKIISLENKIFSATASLNQNQIAEAKNEIFDVLQILDTEPDNHFLFALAHLIESRIYFAENNYNAAISALNTGVSRIENVGYLPLEAKIYEELSANYFALNNISQSQKYQNLYTNKDFEVNENKKEGISFLVKLFENYAVQNLEYQEEIGKKEIVKYSVILAAILLALLLYYVFEVYRGKNLKKQLLFFENFSKENVFNKNFLKENIILEEPKEIVKTDDRDAKKRFSISKEKEIDILRKLDDLEKSDRFLNKTMSLATLAGQLETNTKYLSEVINKYKGKNYNTYINELRVNHIAYLLKTDPVYLSYKVSYLADISGFSSHSSFATIFKSVTGMTPNTYIQQINKSST